MSIATLPRAALLPALAVLLSSAALAQGLDDKTAGKLLKSDLKSIEKTHKDATKLALNDLKADLGVIQDDIDLALEAGALPPPGELPPTAADVLADVFAAYSEYARRSTAADEEAIDGVAMAAGSILNDPEASGNYPPGFVIGKGSGIDQTVRKIRDGSAKNADKAVKLAKKVLQTLEKDLGYLAQVSLETSMVPGLAPVVRSAPADGGEPPPYLDIRAYAPTIDLAVVGRHPDSPGIDRVFVGGLIDIALGVPTMGVELYGPSGDLKEVASVSGEVDEDSGRWSATFESINASDGLCDPKDPDSCLIPEGNYVVRIETLGVEQLIAVTRPVGMP